MPLYEYQCKKCDNLFELLIQNSGVTPVCPVCGSEELDRLFSTFSARVAPTCANAGSCPGASSQCGCACHGHCEK